MMIIKLKKTAIIISVIMILIVSLSIGFNVKAAENVLNTPIESQGRLEVEDSSGSTIILDAQDIQDNANDISALNNNLTADGQPFRYGYDSESDKYGYIRKVDGADTFFPFKSSDVFKMSLNMYAGTNVSISHSFDEVPYNRLKYTMQNTTNHGAVYVYVNGVQTPDPSLGQVFEFEEGSNITIQLFNTGGWTSYYTTYWEWMLE